jgi:hypothetical protein
MKYEVYENNGGAVMLAILDDDCKPVAIFENWEYGQRGILADALQELAADPTAWRAWDGDLVERIASEWPYSGEAEPPTLTELYDEISGSNACIIDSDGDMIPAQRMGAAALKALGLSLEDDDQ